MEIGPSWIEDFSDAHLGVEVGLADFGDPDLLIICRTGSGNLRMTPSQMGHARQTVRRKMDPR
jgi:hypothetical protein